MRLRSNLKGIAAKAEEDGMENAEGTAEDENRRAVEKLIVTWDEEVPPTRLPGLSEAAHQILTNGLTSLNLSGCHLIDDDVGNIALSWTPWLREINLARKAWAITYMYPYDKKIYTPKNVASLMRDVFFIDSRMLYSNGRTKILP